MAELIEGMDLLHWIRREVPDSGAVTAIAAEVLRRVTEGRRHQGDHRYAWRGDLFRVFVAGDVVSLPDEHWSCGGFGQHISEEWLLGGGAVPFPGKSKERRRALAWMVRAALADQHGYRRPDWTISADAPEDRR